MFETKMSVFRERAVREISGSVKKQYEYQGENEVIRIESRNRLNCNVGDAIDVVVYVYV